MREFRKTYHNKGVHLYVAELDTNDQVTFQMHYFNISEIQESPFCTVLLKGRVKTFNDLHEGFEWVADPTKRFGNSMVFPGNYSVLAKEPSIWICLSPIPLPHFTINPPKLDYIYLRPNEPLADSGILAYGIMRFGEKTYRQGDIVPEGSVAIEPSIIYVVNHAQNS